MQAKKEPPKAIVPKNKNAKVYSTANDPLQITDEMFEQDMLVGYWPHNRPVSFTARVQNAKQLLMYLDELQKLKHSNDGGDEQFYATAESVGRGLRSYTLHLPKLYNSPLQDEHGHGHGHGHGEKKSRRDNGEHGHDHELSDELAVLPPLGEINTAPEIAAYVSGTATPTVCC
jgi:hypothetical protein